MKKHSKTLSTFVFLSTLIATTIILENIFTIPKNDFFLILQRILYFSLSVVISGIMIAFLSRKILLTIIAINTFFILASIF